MVSPPGTSPMLDTFTHTRFHSDLALETCFPEGVLDHLMAALMVSYISFEEAIATQPFHRYLDLSRLTDIDLDFSEISSLAAERSAACVDLPPVRSAILAPTAETFSAATIFANLMEQTPVNVRVFKEVHAAADWLETPVSALMPDAE